VATPVQRDQTRRRAVGAAIVLAAALAGRAAHAQQITGFAQDRFEPAGASSWWMYFESLDYDGHLRPAFAGVLDWAWKPLVLYDPAGNEVEALVSQQAVLNLDASLTLWNRARVDLDMPVVALNGGSEVQIADQTYGAPHGAGIGDLRLGADVRLLGRPHDGLRLAVGGRLYVPTGNTASFTGDGGLRFWPRLMLAGERGRLAWATQAGVHLRPSDKCGCDLAPGNELSFGAAVGWWLSPQALARVEVYGSDALSSGAAFAKASVAAEALIGALVALTPGWRVDFGLAPGIANGPGSPTLRALVGLQFDLEAYSRPPRTSTDVPAAQP
jgi:OOP family OmpA-OmpF porin